MNEVNKTNEIETQRQILRAECLKVQQVENVIGFSSYSARDSILTMPTTCLIDPAATKESRKVIRKAARELIELEGREVITGGQNCWSYATGERHAIAKLCDESTKIGFLKSDR
jgi:uncharacterized protein (DUF3084 family)